MNRVVKYHPTVSSQKCNISNSKRRELRFFLFFEEIKGKEKERERGKKLCVALLR